MPLGPIRPRFVIIVPGSVEEAVRRVRDAAEEPGGGCVSRVLGRHVDITVDRALRRRWSPCVQMEFDAADDQTTVHGLIGPHPNTWTLYAFININIVLVMFFGLGFAIVQMSLSQRPWALWIAGAGIPALGAMYLLSQLGRRRAADQTRLLMALVERALGAQDSDSGPAGSSGPSR